MHGVPAEDEIPSCFSFQIINKCAFKDLFNAMCFEFLFFLLIRCLTLLLGIVLRGLSSVPKCKKTNLPYRKKNTCVR